MLGLWERCGYVECWDLFFLMRFYYRSFWSGTFSGDSGAPRRGENSAELQAVVETVKAEQQSEDVYDVFVSEKFLMYKNNVMNN